MRKTRRHERTMPKNKTLLRLVKLETQNSNKQHSATKRSRLYIIILFRITLSSTPNFHFSRFK